jgi:hypothetical protein
MIYLCLPELCTHQYADAYVPVSSTPNDIPTPESIDFFATEGGEVRSIGPIHGIVGILKILSGTSQT